MRILVIEDEKEVGQFLKENLEAECFSVDWESDGERGSYLARTNEYDLIILDNLLPNKDGPRICRELREANNNVPILVLSVQADTSRKVDLLDIGADDYLPKPFSYAELLARVKALLRRPPEVIGETIQVEDLSINTHTYAVQRGSKKVYLTRKEFELLGYLMRNKGKVLSRGMIMEHVWDINADPFSNTIETHILNLRKKIDQGTRHKLIHTVSGRGYKIDSTK